MDKRWFGTAAPVSDFGTSGHVGPCHLPAPGLVLGWELYLPPIAARRGAQCATGELQFLGGRGALGAASRVSKMAGKSRANHGTSAEFRDTISLRQSPKSAMLWVEMIPQFLDCLNGDAATILFVSFFFFWIFASEEVLSMSQAEQFQSESIDLVI